MGIVSDEEFDKAISQASPRKKNERALDNATILDIKKGRGEGKTNTPDIVRETIAKCALEGEGTGSEIARAFGISQSSVSAYKVGAHSTNSYHEPDQDLISKVLRHKATISKRAAKLTLKALANITEEKLEATKAVDLSTIAKNMSTIIADMEPKQNEPHQQNNVQFVFMAPRVKNIEEYRTIHVAE